MRCVRCGSEAFSKAGLDHQDRQVYQCAACRRRQTARSVSAFCGYRFPDDVIALAVRWYLRFRLPYADITELLAERGVHVDASTVFDWVQRFTPLYSASPRSIRTRRARIASVSVSGGLSTRPLSGWPAIGSMPTGLSTSTAR